MFDIEVFRYELTDQVIRLTQVKSYRDGVLQPAKEKPIDVGLGRTCVGENFAVAKAYEFLQTALPAAKPTTAWRSRAALLLDDQGLAATEGWGAFALMVLAVFTNANLDRAYFNTSDEAGGRAIELNTSIGRMLGFLHGDGMLEVLRVGRVGKEVHYMRDNGWIKSAVHVSLEHRAQTPKSMRDLQQSNAPASYLHSQLQSAFWRDVAAKVEDPWLKQAPLTLWRGTTWYDNSVYVQPKPELTFDVGSESELLDLLYSYFSLLIVSGRGEIYREALMNDDCFDVKLSARHGDHISAEFVGTSARLGDRRDHPVLDALIGILQPTAFSLRGGPRLSQAEAVPAAISCILETECFGFTHPLFDPANHMSAHELLGHTNRLIAFLERHGRSDVAALVETL